MINKNKFPFYTIGHSTRNINEFIEILKHYKINYVIDVRSVPKSKTNPQYNIDLLPQSLKAFKIKYKHFKELGGLRSKYKNIHSHLNSYWQTASFKNYADYATSTEFLDTLSKVIELGKKNRCVIMCAEILWWKCHRRIITDYLLAAKETVFHILNKNNFKLAEITSSARLEKKIGALIYPAEN